MKIKSHHRIITETWRSGKTDAGAADEAMDTVRRAVDTLCEVWPLGKGARIHIEVSVEYDLDAPHP